MDRDLSSSVMERDLVRYWSIETPYLDDISKQPMENAFSGEYNEIPAMMIRIEEGQLKNFNQLLSLSQKNAGMPLLYIHRIVKHGQHYVACEKPTGTLTSYLESKKRELLNQREDGCYDMNERFKDILRQIFKAVLFLKENSNDEFSLNLKLEQIYVRIYGDSPLVKVLPSIEENSTSILPGLIENIFALFSEFPLSRDISYLQQKLNDKNVAEVDQHPAFLEYWQKMDLIYRTQDVSRFQFRNCLNKTIGCPWPVDPDDLFNKLADKGYDRSRFSEFIRLIRNKLQHYDRSSIHGDVLKKCPNALSFVRYVEAMCPHVWIALTAVLSLGYDRKVTSWAVYDVRGQFME